MIQKKEEESLKKEHTPDIQKLNKQIESLRKSVNESNASIEKEKVLETEKESLTKVLVETKQESVGYKKQLEAKTDEAKKFQEKMRIT